MILNGWKEIAKHIGRGVRTVQRWEALGLPVRRPRQHIRSSVIAFSEEIDSWLLTFGPLPAEPEDPQGTVVRLRSRADELLAEARALESAARQLQEKAERATLRAKPDIAGGLGRAAS